MFNIDTTSTADLQHKYVEEQAAIGTNFNVVAAGAFVRGIRDLGYKDNGKALAELVDNSWEAGATRCNILLNTGGGAKRANSISEIAIVDNGCGMEPAMIRHAARWGGTHREGSTSGLGRYGFGLPASCVSVGQRFEIYSRQNDGAWFMTFLDLQDVASNPAHYEIPEAREASLPSFVTEALGHDLKGPGTVIVITKIDRLKSKTVGNLTAKLMPHFGVTYHKLRQNFEIYIDGNFVDPIDPIFTTPGMRLFDSDADRAVSLDPIEFEVNDPETRTAIGKLRVRLSYYPPTFGMKDKSQKSTTDKNANQRWHIMNDYHGIVVSRMGRVIDVVGRTPWGRFVNYDRFIGIELEFDASLDSEFGVTTSKQQITLSDRIWDKLEEEGLKIAISALRKKAEEFRTAHEKNVSDKEEGEQKTSGDAFAEAKKLIRPVQEQIRRRQREEGEERIKKIAEKKSAETGKPVEEILKEFEITRKGTEYEVRDENAPHAPFFRAEMEGMTKVVYLNKAHRFYSELYMGPETSPRLRNALEILILALGDSVLDASDEAQRLYMVESVTWSQKIELALDSLSHRQNSDDTKDAAADEAELEDEPGEGEAAAAAE